MYWVRLKRLKKDLIEGRLSEHQAFRYFMAVLIVDALLINSTLSLPGEFTPNIISLAHFVVPMVIIVVATLWLYRVNGGASGSSFFIRYFPLVWVVGIRFVPAAVVIFGAWFYVQFQAGQYEPAWQDVVLWNGLYALYYWRVWIYLRDVRSRAVAT